MKVLITSGGTKVKIDLVRSITNMSRGTFGSQICDSFWKKLILGSLDPWAADKKNEIVFFHAKNSRMPRAEAMHNERYDTDFDGIRYVEYDTFDDYRTKLTDLLKSEWKKVLVEDWGSEQTFTDAGYGDDDCFRMRLRETMYRMCPHCKHLVRESSRLLQEGPEYRHCESDGFIKKCDIRPADWAHTYPKITIKD